MITTVTLNAAVDKIYTVAGFGLNAVHRIEGGLTVPGGKGVNAARVIRTLGQPVRATGFVAGHTGRLLIDGLSTEGVSADFIETAYGETRLAITVLDPATRTQTELIESGPTVGPLELAALRRKIATLAEDSAWVVLSGSLPPGCPPDLYAELCTLAKERGARVALDASGEALRLGLRGKPDLVKPNEDEAARFAGIDATRPDAAEAAASQLLEAGAQLAVISLGARGALAVTRDARYRVSLPDADIVSALGSGDAMVAGLVSGAVAGLELPAMLRQGAACGTAAALHAMAGKIELQDVERLKQGITVTLV
ncbi:phosphofructokinase [Paenibacillus polymyxa]|uniref:1-phosphofructokinase family hexose kinase n=1 Tax=Paenibacillus polymyxa TaxID=1406 RepID=UPI00042E8C84|nr:1-phosphofructokinase family hexose kinase [Paenibacillus polymyxa]AHM68321.1 tagatose-6-phosphate kinase, phosphofructokinase i [Paenibacillus polymyxa SQR-21]AIY09047.1 phosphofructokinase [Paenibacillus polymyxa]